MPGMTAASISALVLICHAHFIETCVLAWCTYLVKDSYTGQGRGRGQEGRGGGKIKRRKDSVLASVF